LAVLIALGTLLVGIVIETRRRNDYRERFFFHYQNLGPDYGFFCNLPRSKQLRMLALLQHHAAMAERYRMALSIPFFFVGPDPPESTVPLYFVKPDVPGP
jgi:hypothetical protein